MDQTISTAPTNPTSATPTPRAWLAGVALLLAATLGLSAVGLPDGTPAVLGPATMLQAFFSAGVPAAAYVLAGFGYAGVVCRWLCPSGERWWVQLGVGLGVMLWLSHALGVLGAWRLGMPAALLVVVLGVGLFVVDWLRSRAGGAARLGFELPLSALVAVPGMAVLLVAASNPPGALWRSEARGYDALSYHLPLAFEWAGAGRLWPLGHNVYSYLPGYVEGAFLHLHVLRPGGLRGGAGFGLLACQCLSALCAVMAALLTGRVGWVVAERAGVGAAACRVIGGLGGAAMLCVPWVVVTGSLAYNESAVLALTAAALLAALDTGNAPWKRAALAGLLVGAACGCKPTALFLCGPMVGLALLAGAPRGAWLRMTMAGCAAGLLFFGPPLLRNWAASGNPVFPAATGMFGTGGWSAEQVARFNSGHTEAAGVARRAEMLVGTAPDATSLDQQPRGVNHRQWAGLFPLGVLGLLAGLTHAGLRRVSAVLLVGVGAGCVWWVGFSHAQSRFLLPLAVPLCVGYAVALARLWLVGSKPEWRTAARLGLLVAGATPLAQGATSLSLFLSENPEPGRAATRPNLRLTGGPGLMSGETFREQLQAATPTEQREFVEALGPVQYVNLALPPDEGLYLLGDATPLYYLGSRPADKLLYNTTWDHCPLGEAARAAPDDPAAWTRAIRAKGARFVLVSLSEVERLRRSGWFDPLVDQKLIERWLAAWGEPVKVWPESGHALFRLKDPGPPPGSGAA